jgi:phosphatidylserine/phosphatidylglycerophosphate/cardiolipin synthase-like enzyme
MLLLVQPDEGVPPILKAIERARKSIDLHIFRIDRREIEDALQAAVRRGVLVRTLIAHTSHGGEAALRKLELRLLGIGATVSRSADDLLRYHGKLMILDRRKLYVLGFNLTRNDMEKSRSLGIVTQQRALVEESLKLFEADFNRQLFRPSVPRFLVSPLNARERLAAFIKGARRQLLIYGTVTDNAMIRLLKARAGAGVDVRILGKLEKGHEGAILAERYPGKRLHVRALVRDARAAFLGSQGLRKAELDKRREIGVIVRDARVVKRMGEIFEADWAQTEAGRRARGRESKTLEGAA